MRARKRDDSEVPFPDALRFAACRRGAQRLRRTTSLPGSARRRAHEPRPPAAPPARAMGSTTESSGSGSSALSNRPCWYSKRPASRCRSSRTSESSGRSRSELAMLPTMSVIRSSRESAGGCTRSSAVGAADRLRAASAPWAPRGGGERRLRDREVAQEGKQRWVRGRGSRGPGFARAGVVV